MANLADERPLWSESRVTLALALLWFLLRSLLFDEALEVGQFWTARMFPLVTEDGSHVRLGGGISPGFAQARLNVAVLLSDRLRDAGQDVRPRYLDLDSVGVRVAFLAKNLKVTLDHIEQTTVVRVVNMKVLAPAALAAPAVGPV